MSFSKKLLLVILITACLGSVRAAAAADFSSDSFVFRDPVLLFSGGRATSTNFEVIGGLGQLTVRESTTTVFGVRSGFFYFPLITSPVLAAVAGDAQVTLSWSAAVGALGLNVAAYAVGQSTASAGPFSFTSVGNVLSSLRTGLANGATYYFLVRALDIFGNTIASSSVVSALPASTGAVGAGVNFNAAPGIQAAPTVPESAAAVSVSFSGASIPGSTVVILRNGIAVFRLTVDRAGNFSVTLPREPVGQSVYSLYSQDEAGNSTALLTVAVNLAAGQSSIFAGLVLPPLAEADYREVKSGDEFTVFGRAAPAARIFIELQGPVGLIFSADASASGDFSYLVPTNKLPRGAYQIKVRAARQGATSPASKTIFFIIGERSLPLGPAPSRCGNQADFNLDCRTNLIDFSIMIYWFTRRDFPLVVDLNGDQQVDLIDFSVLMYYWTG